jgi:hypothetical protein
MEILFRGKLPEDKVWKGTCYHCKSIVAAKQSELEVKSGQREGVWSEAACPVCHKKMTFYPEER